MVFQTKIKLASTEISRFGKIRNKLLSQPLHTLHLQEFAKRGQKKPLQVPTYFLFHLNTSNTFC